MNAVTKASSLRPNTTPIDPDVKVPRAVQEAAARASAAQAAAYPQETPEPAPAPATGDTIKIAEPPAAVTPPGNTPPTPPVVATPEPTPTPVPDETWEHKFNSERGRHQRTQTMLTQATDRLTALENLVQEMRTAPAPVAPTPAPAAPTRLVSEQEENEFGTEMLDVMGRRAKEIVSPELAALRAEMDALKGKLTGTEVAVKRNARADMLASLDAKLPDWRQVNDLAEFKSWLALPDPYFGVIRHSELLKAFEQNDTPRVLAFFKGFVSELAATTPADGSPAPTPAAPQPAKPGLETLAAPGRARTPAQSNVPAEKQIITTADIDAFYKAKAKGAYTGREQEFAALEQELFKAQREGRVRAV